MESPWAIIEGAPEAAAALTWKRWLGPAFDAVAAACLRDTKREVKRVPCENGCECSHVVRKRGTGLVGVCDCGEDCDDVPLAAADVKVWELDLAQLGRSVARALDCRAVVKPFGPPRTMQLAALGNPPLPILLTIQPDADQLTNCVAQLVARLPKGFILLTPTRIGEASALELLAKANAGCFDLETHLELLDNGRLHAPKSGAELVKAHLPKERGTTKDTGEKCCLEKVKKRAPFYLSASPAGTVGQLSGAVFHKVEGEKLAEKLCGLFRSEYGGRDVHADFRFVAAETIPVEEQVRLDESLDWLGVYDDPDPGVYDPEPTKEMMVLAQYGVRARIWEELLQKKLRDTEPTDEANKKVEDFLEVDTAQALPRSAEVASAPQYLIRQEATRQRAGKQDRTMVSIWRVCYQGIECLLPPLTGSELVVFLIANQGRKFNASELTEAVRKSNGIGDGIAANAVLFGDDKIDGECSSAMGRIGELNESVVIWDAAEIERVKGKIKTLKDELKQYEEAGDYSSNHYQDTKTELEGWQHGMRLNTKRVGGELVPKEIQKGSFTVKANLIQKNIRKFLDKHLRDNCRPLYDHLNDKKILKFGVSNSYQPKPRIKWVIEMKKGT